ncbi:MAG: hypothetical protein HN350_05935 [Phycisphaerales bacterium]|nr:hypothetical protein [Phycisphaerales bacterium]
MTTTGANRSGIEQTPRAAGVLEAMWRPAGIVYLAVMLIGLAIGLWPESIRGACDPYSRFSVYPLQTLALAQVAFYLLVYPVITLFRMSGRRTWRLWPDAIVETLFWAFITCVFYVPAVWLSASVPADAIRAAGYVCCFWPLAWVCSLWLVSGKPAAAMIVFISVFTAIGLPWLWYVSAEFFQGAGFSEALWNIAPLTRCWDIAAPSSSEAVLGPVWSIILWPILAVVLFALWIIMPERGNKTD